ncbi:DEAD/DEAH box helicase [Paenibacillus sp. J5C2022]|uniref:DEAD/DEAH box helicase n=1 Tax=Paenibacillus sp. J5C2022 TaxID=2977129 RepID=UPI0021D33471|nr:DEAD/DEAH box helicase [Paenibacillus sp. J5C2022]
MITGASLSKRQIKELCGNTSYTRGMNDQIMRKVHKLSYDPNEFTYHAVVRGSSSYQVAVMIDEHTMDVEAQCNCPAFATSYQYCKHVAAVMLEVEELVSLKEKVSQPRRNSSVAQPAKDTAGLSWQERQVSEQLLALFEADSHTNNNAVVRENSWRDELTTEFICKMSTGYQESVEIELKVGVSRTYVVHKIKDFLTKLASGQSYPFTKKFTYDSDVHVFRQQDEDVLKLLHEIYGIEQCYKKRQQSYPYSISNGDRALFIPPAFFQQLLKLLKETNTEYTVNGRACPSLAWKDEPPPITFGIERGRQDREYWLSMTGIQELLPIHAYQLAVGKQGEMYKLGQSELARLHRLQSIASDTGTGKVAIPAAQLEPYLNQVIPGLRQIGKLTIDARVEERIVNEPLQSHVYLDYQDGLLRAKVEFQYGKHVIPCFVDNRKEETTEVVILRQKEEEAAILTLLRHAGFQEKRAELVLDSEDGQYAFLYGSLTHLQTVAEVYATNAVKAIQPERRMIPKTSVEADHSLNWLEVTFDMEGVNRKDLLKLLQSIREKRSYHRLSDGAFVSLEDEAFREIDRLFDELGMTKAELKGGKVQLSLVRGLSLAEWSDSRRGNVKLGKSLKRLLHNLRYPDNLEFELPASITGVLRDYQLTGFQWMKMLSYYGFGGILADDMGLGKTLQSIAYIVSEHDARPLANQALPPTLIVCPASLMFNWKHEFAKFAPHIRCAVMSGTRAERESLAERVDQFDVMIISYPLLRRDTDLYEERKFHSIIIDEAQAIKNHTTQTAQAIKSLVAKHRFALTGTPIENRIEELWSIYNAIFPELFAGRQSFKELSPEQIARKTRPFMMRRLKRDVLTELPDKIETLQTSELIPEQKKLYMAYLMRLKEETVQQLNEAGFQKSRLKILAGLTRLRQLCCHPSLFVEDYGGKSGKLEQLMEMIEEYMDVGRRVLVFSQFTGMLSIIREELNARSFQHFYLDGSTKSSERVELCRRFNTGERSIFLISLKAGGTGLNLTGADTVVLYDMWWNPAVEQQAADRAHRIGQQNVVQVIRMMTAGTIEEKMYELQQEKRDLIDKVVQPGEEQLSALSEQDIRELLAL